MMTMNAWIKKHAVLLYYVLAFAMSSGAVLVTIALTGMPTTKEQLERLMPVAIAGQLLGPSISGLLMIGLTDGKRGFRDLLSRLGRWRVGVHWLVIALFLAPVLLGGFWMALSLISPVYLPGVLTRDDWRARLTLGLTSAVAVGICEELGWVGFVTPKLRQRYSVLATGIMMGVLWGLWHIVPMVIWPSVAYSAPLSPGLYIAIRTASFVVGGLVAFRVLMVWVYDHTHSLLLMILMHIGLTAANIIYEPEAISGPSLYLADFVGAAVQWILVAAVLSANRRVAARRSLAPGMQQKGVAP